jgi:hypothetical protein
MKQKYILIFLLFIFPPALLKAKQVVNSYNLVKISSFTAEYNAKQNIVHLHWVTTKPIKNEQFLIERSADSIYYEKLGETPSINNTATQHYYFDDNNPMGGEIFYRIEEIDGEGHSIFTPAIAVYKPFDQLEVSNIYYDSTNSIRFVVLSPQPSIANITVADISGNVKQSYLVNLKEGSNILSSYIRNLTPGIYFLQVNDKKGGGSVIKRFIKKGEAIKD